MVLEKQIMVVDDIEINLILIKNLLNKYKYSVETYQEPSLAYVQLLKSSSHYGLVLLDYIYQTNPEFTGLDFMRNARLQKQLKHKPIILLDASREYKVENLFLNSGGVAVLRKPINEENLLAYVKRFYNTSIRKL